MAKDTLCDWKSGEGVHDTCEDCGKLIPKGGDVHWIWDGGDSPDGTYVGLCCLANWITPLKAAALPVGGNNKR